MDWLRQRFRSSPPPAAELPAAARHLASARAALHAADGREALRQIALGIEADPGYLPLYKLVATAYAMLPTGQNEWKLFAAVAERPNDPQPFHELGRHFTGTPSHRTAIPLLERALALAPGDVAISRALAEALLGDFRPEEARERLGQVDVGGDAHARFLLEHARFLCGETEGTRQYVEGQHALDRDAELRERLDQLAESLARRASVPEPGSALRAWHFIQYGAALLHVAEGEGRGGRFGHASLSEEDVSRLVARLRALLEATGRMPETIVSLPDTDSRKVAGVVAAQLGVPLESLPSPMANRSTRQMIEDVERERTLLARSGSLVVAADNRKLESYPAFQQTLPGQTVFALTHSWLDEALLTPDVSGVMCQRCVFSWTAPVKTPPEPGPRTRLSGPEPPVRLAPKRKEAPAEPVGVPEELAAFDDALSFYRERAALLKGGSSSSAQRWRFRRDGPVADGYTS